MPNPIVSKPAAAEANNPMKTRGGKDRLIDMPMAVSMVVDRAHEYIGSCIRTGSELSQQS